MDITYSWIIVIEQRYIEGFALGGVQASVRIGGLEWFYSTKLKREKPWIRNETRTEQPHGESSIVHVIYLLCPFGKKHTCVTRIHGTDIIKGQARYQKR